jgi:pyruvate dehydrogenase E2 component (dihydrolipoamide acetyltransferase)
VDPDKMSLDDVMTSLMDLIQRARHGKLKSSEVTGQTLTVTSLGDLGADRVLGMIYPPQVALVGIGRIRSRPWAHGPMIGSVPTVYVTLAGDHRASDGLSGASFLGALDLLLQSPDKLL